jgi:hypothetical protein
MSDRPPCHDVVGFFLSSLPVRLAKNLSIVDSAVHQKG